MIRVPFGRPTNRGSVPDSAQTSRRAWLLSFVLGLNLIIHLQTLTLRMNGTVPPLVCHKWLDKYDRISAVFLDALVPIFCSNSHHSSLRKGVLLIRWCLSNEPNGVTSHITTRRSLESC